MLFKHITVAFTLATASCGVQADLTGQEFVEAVALLGLSPDVVAAAGMSESELVDLYEEISTSDSRWGQVQALRMAVRTALDSLVDGQQGDGMLAVELAQDALGQAVGEWRAALTATVQVSTQSRINQMTSQSKFGLPVYLLVRSWTHDELVLMCKGVADQRRRQQAGGSDQSEALVFYLDALNTNDVLNAKANWDARKSVYTQRFTEQLSALE